jgi:3-methyladenine DNA glycosylase AlkD
MDKNQVVIDILGLGSKIFPTGAKSVPELRQAAKIWVSQHKDFPAKEFESLVTAFILEPSALQKCMGGILLGYMPAQRSTLNPFLYEKWLEYTVGWDEVDAICYGQFTAKELLTNFKAWKQLIINLSQSDNINKRRASMVLLTKPVKELQDKRLSELSFSIIDTLKNEKHILITKAVSWLLRNLIKLYREEVEEYLKSNENTLPKIAVRETLNKLESGRKAGF